MHNSRHDLKAMLCEQAASGACLMQFGASNLDCDDRVLRTIDAMWSVVVERGKRALGVRSIGKDHKHRSGFAFAVQILLLVLAPLGCL